MTWFPDALFFVAAICGLLYVAERALLVIAVVRDIKREQFELRRDLKVSLSEIVKCRDSHSLAQAQLRELKGTIAEHRDEIDRLFDHTGARREINRF